MMSTNKYVYVAGYLDGYRRDTNATYAKYLCVDLKKKLKLQGMDCCIMSLK